MKAANIPPQAWGPIYLAAIQDLLAFRARCKQLEARLAHWLSESEDHLIQADSQNVRYSVYAENGQIRILEQPTEGKPPKEITVTITVPCSQWGRHFLNNAGCFLQKMGGTISPISRHDPGVGWTTEAKMPEALLPAFQSCIPDGVKVERVA